MELVQSQVPTYIRGNNLDLLLSGDWTFEFIVKG